jgi:hypothetical protein
MRYILLIITGSLLAGCNNAELSQEEKPTDPYGAIRDTSRSINDSLKVADSSARGVTH